MDLRLSRNGDYMWFAWIENVDSGVTDAGLWAAQYLTTRPDEDGLFAIRPCPTRSAPPTTSTSTWISSR